MAYTKGPHREVYYRDNVRGTNLVSRQQVSPSKQVCQLVLGYKITEMLPLVPRLYLTFNCSCALLKKNLQLLSLVSIRTRAQISNSCN